jgi:RNA polymerase sigma-70 factor, ECF subfamily
MERALVEQARAGDAHAFEELVRRRIDTVYRTAVGILGEPADARDATQEAFIAAWRQLPSLRDADRFDAWLRRITVNSCRMILRRRRVVREIAMPQGDGGLSGRFLPPPDLAAIHFDDAFEQLPVEQRALLLEHHLDGRSVAEMAAAHGVPAGTVKSRLFTARRALERALAEADR